MICRRTPGIDMRRPSIRSDPSIDHSTHDRYDKSYRSDIESARKKIQRNTILQAGCSSVELWRASLNAIVHSRKIFLLAPVFRMSAASTFAPVLNDTDNEDSDHRIANYPRPNNGHLDRSISALSMESGSSGDNDAKRSYAATLMTTSPADSAEPELAITNITSFPVIPSINSGNRVLKAGVGSREHSSSSEDRGSSSTGQTMNGPIERDDDGQKYVGYQSSRLAKLRSEHGGESNGYRDASLRCQLPLPMCLQILGQVMEAKEMAVLGKDKQAKAFAWGQKKGTLRSEFEWRMKDESSQILLLLSEAECVEY